MKPPSFRFTIGQLLCLIVWLAYYFSLVPLLGWPSVVAIWGMVMVLEIWIRNSAGPLIRRVRQKPLDDEELGPIVWRGLEDHDLRHPQAEGRQA